VHRAGARVKSMAEAQNGRLKIGDVARMVRISPSALRGWERLGLIAPQRTDSRYRLYAPADVKLLKHIVYLNRARGMNAPAIIEMLRRQGRVRRSAPASATPGGLGPRLRQARLRRKLPLARVAAAAGVSVGFLSALERSQTSASIGTLRRLARFYGLNLLDFFDRSAAHPPVVRPSQRKVLEAGAGVRMELLAWGDTVMEPHLFRIAPGKGSGSSYAHEGEEFLFVMRGEFEIRLKREKHHLKAGDSLYFPSSTPHQWHNPGKKETVILWINTPPTF
jgi:DNA-binding transcriptional MerR regulator/mannose-6-phosphate isomerase-like protein (cupin superfamily)